MSRTFAGVRRTAFAVLLAPSAVLLLVLGALDVPSDVRLGLLFLPVLALLLWNKSQERDRFHGLALPTFIFASFVSLGGFAEGKSGVLLESLHAAGVAGTIISLVWIMTLLMTLWGAPERY